MMHRNALPVGLIIGLFMLLAACSSTGKLEMTQVKTAPIGANRTVSLNIIGSAETRTTQQLRGDLFGRLVSERIFVKVLQANEPADYKLTVTILETNTVSPVARIMLGVFAGSNKLRCDVKLIESATGNLKSSFVVTGESALHPMSSESGLENAVREVVANIITALR
jgi:hypothetical protein